jgi:hypothetical protein
MNNGAIIPLADSDRTLHVFEETRRALTLATTVAEVKPVLIMAAAIIKAAKEAKNKKIAAEAVILKMEAERKLGLLMRAQAASVGLSAGARGSPIRGARVDDKPTLAATGIDKNLAHRARVVGKMSDAEFEQAKEEKRETVLASAPGKSAGNAEANISRRRHKRRLFHADQATAGLRMLISLWAADIDEAPAQLTAAADFLFADAEFIDDLTTLARHPQVSAIGVAVAAKLDGGDRPTIDHEAEIRRVGLESENAELVAENAQLKARIIALEQKIAEFRN